MSEPIEESILRKAVEDDQTSIWEIIQQAIIRRKIEGSSQWQDGYPNINSIKNDIENSNGFVLELNGEIAAYAALIFGTEPAYETIEGEWLSNNDYLVVHRVAVSDLFAGKGIATEIFREIEEIARLNNTFSIRVDTNFDNTAMLKILEKLGYSYCGEVYYRGHPRKAFEKQLN